MQTAQIDKNMGTSHNARTHLIGYSWVPIAESVGVGLCEQLLFYHVIHPTFKLSESHLGSLELWCGRGLCAYLCALIEDCVSVCVSVNLHLSYHLEQ